MSDEPLRYAVVGLGRAGWNIHVAQLRGRPDMRLIAVVDPVDDRREEAVAEFGCKAYDTYEPILAHDDVDVVVLATPSIGHADESIRAMQAGKHVVVEKPMAMNVAEADAMLKTARRTHRELFVNLSRRYGRMFTYVKQTLDSGLIGELFLIRCFVGGQFGRRNDWQTLRRQGGGELNNAGSHMLDVALAWLGRPIKRVLGQMRQIAAAGDVEDHVKCLLLADNGAAIDLEISRVEALDGAKPPEWTFCGTHGTMTLHGKEATVRWFDPAEAAPLEVIDGAAPNRRYGNDYQFPFQQKTEPAIGPEVESLYDNVYNVVRRRGRKVCDARSVRQMIRVMGMIRRGTDFQEPKP